jgi:hypothetical protein
VQVGRLKPKAFFLFFFFLRVYGLCRKDEVERRNPFFVLLLLAAETKSSKAFFGFAFLVDHQLFGLFSFFFFFFFFF